ncbi:hypothetical protein GUJ93_ZPchr0011g27236 [Zizania palustris]|uniref:Uncharacterized protein n=1 Tax=Zizania palustris TaxID=103762 RepID=A0A8J6BTW9_ZIZPA|nr:hypothetical protein GUJ93_ZPchr0011g27236 [Zizania palustris]
MLLLFQINSYIPFEPTCRELYFTNTHIIPTMFIFFFVVTQKPKCSSSPPSSSETTTSSTLPSSRSSHVTLRREILDDDTRPLHSLRSTSLVSGTTGSSSLCTMTHMLSMAISPNPSSVSVAVIAWEEDRHLRCGGGGGVGCSLEEGAAMVVAYDLVPPRIVVSYVLAHGGH